MDDSTTELLGLLAIIVGLSTAYSRVFSPFQTQVVQWVIDAFKIKSRYRGITNLAVGVPIALAFSAFGAWKLQDWSLLVMGLLAGFLASVEAGKHHDEEKAKEAQQATKVEAARAEAEPDPPPVRTLPPLPQQRTGLMR